MVKKTPPNIMRHLKALGLERFELCATSGPLYSRVTTKTLEEIENDLRRMVQDNEGGHHYLVRGVEDDDHDLILIGQTPKSIAKRLKKDGHAVAAETQVSEHHFETWVKLGVPVPRLTRLAIAQYLNAEYADQTSEYGPQDFGHVAGFENRFGHERQANKYYPIVRLASATGAITKTAADLIMNCERLKEKYSQPSQEQQEYEEVIAEMKAVEEIVSDLIGVWRAKYVNKQEAELDEIDNQILLQAQEMEADPDIVRAALQQVADRKGKYAWQYAKETVSAIYQLPKTSPKTKRKGMNG
ncbi:MAG: hypothetical protein JXQ89_21730 [Pelagimonas sp.]